MKRLAIAGVLLAFALPAAAQECRYVHQCPGLTSGRQAKALAPRAHAVKHERRRARSGEKYSRTYSRKRRPSPVRTLPPDQPPVVKPKAPAPRFDLASVKVLGVRVEQPQIVPVAVKTASVPALPDLRERVIPRTAAPVSHETRRLAYAHTAQGRRAILVIAGCLFLGLSTCTAFALTRQRIEDHDRYEYRPASGRALRAAARLADLAVGAAKQWQDQHTARSGTRPERRQVVPTDRRPGNAPRYRAA